MADTVNAAIQHAVFSNILLHSTINDQHQHCSQTQPTVYPQCHRPSITPMWIKILHKHTHSLYFNSHVFRNQEGEQNIIKHQWALLQINFLPITWFCNIYSLTPLQNTSRSPVSQNFKQCISWAMIFLCCDIPTVPLEYTTGAQIFPINAQLHCRNYKWQLHVSATQQPSSGCLCEKCNRKFYNCSLQIVNND